MKKLLISIVLVVFIVVSFSVLILATDMELKSNVDKVSADKLEELGDSVMDVMIGNSEMHEQMDKRLGGEGSASLTAFHKKLGCNYLSGYPNGMMNLMSGGIMNPYQGGMMGYFNQGSMMGSLIY